MEEQGSSSIPDTHASPDSSDSSESSESSDSPESPKLSDFPESPESPDSPEVPDCIGCIETTRTRIGFIKSNKGRALVLEPIHPPHESICICLSKDFFHTSGYDKIIITKPRSNVQMRNK